MSSLYWIGWRIKSFLKKDGNRFAGHVKHTSFINGWIRRGIKSRKIVNLISDSGSDPLVVNFLGLKSDQSNKIVNPDSELETVHTDESRIKMLAEMYLKKRDIKTLTQSEEGH